MKLLCGMFLLVAAIVWPSGLASAARVLPPGNSAANQYAQTLPGPGGDEATFGHHKPRSPRKILGKSTTARMRQLGADGRAALRLATETATEPAHSDDRGHSHPRGAAGARHTPAAGGSSGLGEVLRQVTGTPASGSLGVLQPLIILLALVAACAYAITRRRTHPGDG